MSNTDRLFKLAEHFARKISLAQQVQQEDIGTGESKAVVAAVGNKIKDIITKLGIADKVLEITFQGTVNAPSFAVRNASLEKVDVYAGIDADSDKVQAANGAILALKPAIDAALTKFYKTPEGIKILKSSGTPPNLVFSFKWKWQ